MYTHYPGDPHWIEAKFPTKCRKCRCRIKRGDLAFYYPRTRNAYCNGACGHDAEARFMAWAQDEYAYSH